MKELSDFSRFWKVELLSIRWDGEIQVVIGGLETETEFYALFYWHGTYVDILECSRLWRRIKQWMN